jgi:hypothetical protein
MSVPSGGIIGLTLAFNVLTFVAIARAEAQGSQVADFRRPLVATSWARTKDVKKSLSDVLHDAMGNDKEMRLATDVRIGSLEQALRPLYKTLPKNAHGRAEHSAVRYALHRYFVHRHAMYIKGLDPAGEAWNSSSPADVLEDQVPTYVQHLFEERLHDGFTLRDLATFAAALEHFMHEEVATRLGDAYQVGGLSVESSVNTSQLEQALDVHMAMHLVPDMLPRRGSQVKVDKVLEAMSVSIEFWSGVQFFMREILESTLEEEGLDGSSIPFATATTIAKAIQERYGRWQDRDCRSLTKTLAKSEIKGTGRVKLSDFYSAGWRFGETEEYLKNLGALDASDPSQLQVIIPNYVGSVTNCVGTTSLYSTCCIDACEDLLGHLEKHLAKPAASVDQLIDLVSALPSPTVQAPRQLSSSLIGRLHEVAAVHGGSVPLHGRLFAQWLHHAFPMECPFPQKAGSTRPRTADEWLSETGTSAALSKTEQERRVKEATKWESLAETKDLEGGSLEETLPWLVDEELVAHHTKPTLLHELSVLLRALVFVAALSAVLLTTARTLISTTGIESKKKAVWV